MKHNPTRRFVSTSAFLLLMMPVVFAADETKPDTSAPVAVEAGNPSWCGQDKVYQWVLNTPMGQQLQLARKAALCQALAEVNARKKLRQAPKTAGDATNRNTA